MSNRTWEGDAFREELAGPDEAYIKVAGMRNGPGGPGVLIGIGEAIVKTTDWKSLRELIDGLERAAQFAFGPEDVT